MLVLRAANFQGATIIPIVPRHNTQLSLLFTTKFSSARQFSLRSVCEEDLDESRFILKQSDYSHSISMRDSTTLSTITR